MELKNCKKKKIAYIASIPFVYVMVAPIIVSDIFIWMYQNICFRLWGIILVERKKYIKIDRYKLKYLKWFEKINCAYCGYGNGLINYAQAVFAETEKYWCPIKHEDDNAFIEPQHHKEFIDYGDKDLYGEL